jgi:Fis family transcriptional regulator
VAISKASAPHAQVSDGPSADESLALVLRRRVEALLSQLAGTEVEGLYPVVMREVERSLLETVLAHTGGQREAASRILGLHRNSLRLRLRAVGLAAPPRRRRRPRLRGTRT